MQNSAQPQPTSDKKPLKWKKISLILLIVLFLISLVGVGIYLLIPKPAEEPTTQPQKQATPSVKKKAIIYLKPSGEKDNLSASLGDIRVYELSTSKDSAITSGGKVANVIKLSPDGKKLAYTKDLGENQSLWIYTFGTKKEQQLDEFSETVSTDVFSKLDSIVWENDSSAVAYLVNNRSTKEIFPKVEKNTLYIINLQTNKKTVYDLPLGLGVIDLVGWVDNKVYFTYSTGDYGTNNIKSLNTSTKSVKSYKDLLSGIESPPSVFGSPDSTKISISYIKFVGGKAFDVFKVISLNSNTQEIFSKEVPNSGVNSSWTTDGNSYIYAEKQGDKTKISVYTFKTKKTKFSLLTSKDTGFVLIEVAGFSDGSIVLARSWDANNKGNNYWILNLEKATVTKLPIGSFVTILPFEHH